MANDAEVDDMIDALRDLSQWAAVMARHYAGDPATAFFSPVGSQTPSA